MSVRIVTVATAIEYDPILWMHTPPTAQDVKDFLVMTGLSCAQAGAMVKVNAQTFKAYIEKYRVMPASTWVALNCYWYCLMNGVDVRSASSTKVVAKERASVPVQYVSKDRSLEGFDRDEPHTPRTGEEIEASHKAESDAVMAEIARLRDIFNAAQNEMLSATTKEDAKVAYTKANQTLVKLEEVHFWEDAPYITARNKLHESLIGKEKELEESTGPVIRGSGDNEALIDVELTPFGKGFSLYEESYEALIDAETDPEFNTAYTACMEALDSLIILRPENEPKYETLKMKVVKLKLKRQEPT